MLENTIKLGNSREVTLLSAGGRIRFFAEGVSKGQVICIYSECYRLQEVLEMASGKINCQELSIKS